MKPDFNRKYTTIAVYAFLVLAGAILFGVLVFNFDVVLGWIGVGVSLIAPFISGFCMAYLLNPLMKKFECLCIKLDKKDKLRKKRRVIAIAATYFVAITFLALFIYCISPQIADSVVTIVRKIQIWAPGFIEQMQTILNDSAASEILGEQINSYIGKLGDWALKLSTESISSIVGGVRNVTSAISNVILGIIISIYMLNDKEKFTALSKKLLAFCLNRNRAAKVINVFSDANRIFSGFLIGKLLDSLIIGILCTVGMGLLRLPFAALIGFIVGITNVIPYFGACFGGIVGVLIILVYSPVKALWFLIFIIVLQQIDGNVIGPRILSSSTGISAFWVIFAIVIGGGLFGIMGMLLGVPAFALIYALVRSFINRKMEEKG